MDFFQIAAKSGLMTSLFEGETMNFVKNLRIFLFKRRNAYLRYLCYMLLSRIQIGASFWVYVILRMSSTSMLTLFRNQGHRQGELARPYDRRTASRKLKVGLIGFGALGMRLAEALVDSEFIDLVAIITDCPISDMQKAWKKSVISLRIEGDRTIAFKKQNKGADEEVLVRVVRDRVSWDEVPIDYVVDSLHIVTHNKHVIHSMAYEGEDKAKAYSLVHDDEGTCSQIPKVTTAMELKFKYVKIVVTTAGTIEALKSNLAEWDHEGSSARICFLAHNNPTERICDPFTDKSDNNVDASNRASALLRIFIDLIRHVPISGCQLEL
ncbi:uncharacterized protein LOC124654458 isoform X2 [Lolium rigidum]|uniref:uncharacterized protein LOC124654458 isoform X2 n=1 Tax=Lolium rigidum TaxID=89674 RepID=UPI001F5D5BE9|nr:uncharacterized protein LOC124654458 isoform X2 [Lolium rigidum]